MSFGVDRITFMTVYSVPSKLVPLCSFCLAELRVDLDHLSIIYFPTLFLDHFQHVTVTFNLGAQDQSVS
ncbi:hypothetical protein M6B38_139395 [Iris pallida]|uniref:Uncharacterized protein n=1 Tax=Iris pallida TaxID=29817 RepID=A0AAX6FD56_IRIPA|nr:hypothetical protein M6B38_139395 [Iris pallida]